MSVLDKTNSSIEQVVDGIILYIKRYLIANTPLISDAPAGTTVIQVDNTLRFRRGDQVAVFDNDTVFNPDMNQYEGIELHTVALDPVSTNELVLAEPLGKSFTVSNYGRIQKALRGAVLLEKDVYYGDREVIPFNQVAVCVEPESLAGEWIALRGLLSNEFKCGIMVYVKPKGGGDETQKQDAQEIAQRTSNAYGKALYDMFLGNIHLDILVDEVPLVANVRGGQQYVTIKAADAADWPADSCRRYEVQDNWHNELDFSIVEFYEVSSSSSSSISPVNLSSSSSSSSSENSSSSTSSTETSSSSSRSSRSSESSSTTSLTSASSDSSISIRPTSSSSSSTSTSETSTSASTLSSSSSLHGDWYEVKLDRPLYWNYLVHDKAVLRRKWRFMYDSRVSDVEYGPVQKGSAMLKAARLSWFGKETQDYVFPQVGKGGKM